MDRHYTHCETPLHIFERGYITLERYCREIILDHLRLFKDAISPDFLFMDDNARPHRNAKISNTLNSEDINCLHWVVFHGLILLSMSLMLSEDVFH